MAAHPNAFSTDQHRVLRRFAALSGLSGIALLLYGPLTFDTHLYADGRSWLGVPNAANALVNVPIFWLAVWGWCATRTGGWPKALRLPWQGFHLCAMAAALSSGMYHAAPGTGLFVAASTAMAGAFVLLTLGMLAERVEPRCGSVAVCGGALVLTLLAGAMVANATQLGGPFDLRPLLWLEAAPVLAIAAGVLRLPGSRTRASSWLVALALYGGARLFELTDAAVLRSTGWISGHTLMHAALAIVVGWLAYCAAATPRAAPSVGVPSQRNTSLNTAG